MTKPLLEEVKALVVKPGDMVIFTVPRDTTMGALEEFKAQADEMLPEGVEALMVVGAEVTGVRSADT